MKLNCFDCIHAARSELTFEFKRSVRTISFEVLKIMDDVERLPDEVGEKVTLES